MELRMNLYLCAFDMIKLANNTISFFSLLLFCISCGELNDDIVNDENVTGREYTAYEKLMTDKLIGTSWEYKKLISKNKSENEEGIITFAEDDALYYINYKSHDGVIPLAYGAWEFQKEKLVLLPWAKDGDVGKAGELSFIFGVSHTIQTIDASNLILIDNNHNERYFKRISYTEGNSNNTNNSSDKEIPYIIDFNYTATKSSITVKFMCSERPTSAIVKYGTSSPSRPVSSSIGGKQVSATVTGLASGTKYYFSCTVKNDKGSSTSDEYPAMTLY
jgi:hypothetical protein